MSADQPPPNSNRIQGPLLNNYEDDKPETKLELLQNRTNALAKPATEALRKEFVADSHELAQDVPAVPGAIQKEYLGEDMRDIGWHKPNNEIPDPLIADYSNGQIFAFIRRFNKDVFDVKAVPMQSARGLDLNEAWSNEHAKDKMPLHLQRIYLTVVLGFASFGKQIARLRSWKETSRTSAFCAVYFSAWFFNLLVPLILATLMLIVSSTKARNTLFPPAPRALVSLKTGGIQTPQAGQLGTDDTLTGAPEKQPFEATEEEAANFVKNIRHNIQKAVGMHDQEQEDGDPLEGKIPKPIVKGVRAVQAEGSAAGHIGESLDQTEEPMEELIWKGVNPAKIAKIIDVAPHVVGEIADNWERFANAISPKSPFSQYAFLRIDAVIAPLFLASLIINYYVVYKLTGFAIGWVLFGDPIITPGMSWLQSSVPNYLELIQPKNNVLRNVPTNNQIAITLLRIGEAHNTPLPPVPTSKPSDPDHQNDIDIEKLPLTGTTSAKLAAVNSSTTNEDDNNDEDEQPKHKHISKIVRFFKGNSKAVIEAKLTLDHGRAALGSEKAKGHLGVLPKSKNLIYTGPNEFMCRYQGKPGWAVINSPPSKSQSPTSGPILLFTHDDPRPGISEKLDAEFAIKIADIKRLKRAMAFVSSAIEAMAGFASEKELLGSLEIDDQEGKTWRFTACPERDELFNRLVAVGGQRWVNV